MGARRRGRVSERAHSPGGGGGRRGRARGVLARVAVFWALVAAAAAVAVARPSSAERPLAGGAAEEDDAVTFRLASEAEEGGSPTWIGREAPPDEGIALTVQAESFYSVVLMMVGRPVQTFKALLDNQMSFSWVLDDACTDTGTEGIRKYKLGSSNTKESVESASSKKTVRLSTSGQVNATLLRERVAVADSNLASCGLFNKWKRVMTCTSTSKCVGSEPCKQEATKPCPYVDTVEKVDTCRNDLMRSQGLKLGLVREAKARLWPFELSKEVTATFGVSVNNGSDAAPFGDEKASQTINYFDRHNVLPKGKRFMHMYMRRDMEAGCFWFAPSAEDELTEDHYDASTLRWLPAEHGATAWVVRFRDIQVKVGGAYRSLKTCPPDGCRAAVKTAHWFVTGPATQMMKLVEHVDANPTCLGRPNLPDVRIDFGDGLVFDATQEEYIRIAKSPISGDTGCVGAFVPRMECSPETKDERVCTDADAWGLGTLLMSKFFVIFDGENNRVGLAAKRDEAYNERQCKSKGQGRPDDRNGLSMWDWVEKNNLGGVTTTSEQAVSATASKASGASASASGSGSGEAKTITTKTTVTTSTTIRVYYEWAEPKAPAGALAASAAAMAAGSSMVLDENAMKLPDYKPSSSSSSSSSSDEASSSAAGAAAQASSSGEAAAGGTASASSSSASAAGASSSSPASSSSQQWDGGETVGDSVDENQETVGHSMDENEETVSFRARREAAAAGVDGKDTIEAGDMADQGGSRPYIYHYDGNKFAGDGSGAAANSGGGGGDDDDDDDDDDTSNRNGGGTQRFQEEIRRDAYGVPILSRAITSAPGWDNKEIIREHAPGYGDRVWMHRHDDYVKRHMHHTGYDPVAFNYHQVFMERSSRDRGRWEGTRDKTRFMELRGGLTAEQDAMMPHPDRPRIGNWRWMWRRERDMD